MRFSIRQDGGLVRVTLQVVRLSGKPARDGLKDIQNRLHRDARVLLDIAEVGNLDAAEMTMFLRWVCQLRQNVQRIAIHSSSRGFLATLELMCGHHLVKVAGDEGEALRFLLGDGHAGSAARMPRSAALIRSPQQIGS